jgi:hypothetical protein
LSRAIAVCIDAQTTKATVSNSGRGNFVVQGFAGSSPELAVTTTGSYYETVRLTLPAYVQVISMGDWTIISEKEGWTVSASQPSGVKERPLYSRTFPSLCP